MRRLPFFFAAFALIVPVRMAVAGDVSVAVAANFAAPMHKIAAAFAAATPHRATLVFGSTGSFYAQIRNAAPFDVLLAADAETPARLEQDGLSVKGSRFTYATGRLVLWSAQPGLVDAEGSILRKATGERLAVANPKLAPYGAAAVEAMTRLGIHERLRPRLVQGENVGQAFQMVASGNARLGFVALSQVMKDGRIAEGSAWLVPESLHAPLRQDAVLLAAARDRAAATALLYFMQGETARSIMRGYGYQP